jgi:imidazolonepropionase-like amidohydrolase
MLPGTDDGTGFTLQRELELYVKAGIPAAKTLRLATLDDEKYFKHDQQLGSIARGKLADFILVDGDPTQDISNIRNVRMTMKGGVAYYPAEIYRYLDIDPFSPPPPPPVSLPQ